MKNKCIVVILFEYPLCNRYPETSVHGFKVNIYLTKILSHCHETFDQESFGWTEHRCCVAVAVIILNVISLKQTSFIEKLTASGYNN